MARRLVVELTPKELEFLLGMVSNSTLACDDEEVGTIIGSRKPSDIVKARGLFDRLVEIGRRH